MSVPSPICSVGLVLFLVVDQIDAGVAAVEWNGTDIAYLPVELLPDDVSEGDRLVVRVRRRARRAAARRSRTVRSITHAGRTPEEDTREQEEP